MTTLLQTIEASIRIQDELNKAMASEDWQARAVLPDGAPEKLDYCFAGLDEVAELWRSCVNFKWWTNEELDLANAKVELVDILHFGFSHELVEAESSYGDAAQAIFIGWESSGQGNLPTLSKVIKRLSNSLTYDHGVYDWSSYGQILRNLGLTFEDVLADYLPKVVLNRFRINNGYKDKPRTYIKTWIDGREDNAHLMDYVKAYRTEFKSSPNQLQLEMFLETQYAKVKAAQ